MSNGSFCFRRGYPPIPSDLISRLLVVFIQWHARGAKVFPVTGHHHRRMCTLAAETIDDVGCLTPVGINQALLNEERRTVVAFPSRPQDFLGEARQAGVNCTLK